MRVVAVVACVSVAWNAAEKAAGILPQNMFAPGALWVWWILCAGYAAAALVIFMRGAE